MKSNRPLRPIILENPSTLGIMQSWGRVDAAIKFMDAVIVGDDELASFAWCPKIKVTPA